MNKRKRNQFVADEIIIPAARIEKTIQLATEDRVSRDGRSVKRTNLAYPRPVSPVRPPLSAEAPTDIESFGPGFDFSAFSAFPSIEEVEHYLEADGGEDKGDDGDGDGDGHGHGRKRGERRFATLVS
jgi:hypothetical protein